MLPPRLRYTGYSHRGQLGNELYLHTSDILAEAVPASVHSPHASHEPPPSHLSPRNSVERRTMQSPLPVTQVATLDTSSIFSNRR